MANPLTAERAREIAHDAIGRHYTNVYGLENALNRVSIALIDQRIETLETCAKERCGACMGGSVPTYDSGRYYHDIACLAQFEQRELARLRKERETLTAGSRTIAE